MRDKIARSKKLGALHREVWQYHDKEAYKKLQNSVQALLVDLSFDPHQVKAAADHIKKLQMTRLNQGIYGDIITALLFIKFRTLILLF
ncbi:MAG: hypothetical protein ACE5I5_10255 [Candidatus Heimdallarchaeota archaeon]